MESVLDSPVKKSHDQTLSVLLLEHESKLRRAITVTLQQLNMKVFEASDAESARSILEHQTPRLLILEFDSTNGKTGELIEYFRRKNEKGQNLVLLTTSERPGDVWRQHYRPDIVVYKPFDIRYLTRCIKGST
jgi:DNA-binding response OmpR family regulator